MLDLSGGYRYGFLKHSPDDALVARWRRQAAVVAVVITQTVGHELLNGERRHRVRGI